MIPPIKTTGFPRDSYRTPEKQSLARRTSSRKVGKQGGTVVWDMIVEVGI
jgi:hypothetical protein